MNEQQDTPFSPDYVSARARFREAARALRWQVESVLVEGIGPSEEELTIDVAISPGENATSSLVVSSGLHGVEGFFGSAVQLALMHEKFLAAVPHRSIRLLVLHGLNPFGFAWLRRVDEQNVDPNRNFLLPSESYTGAAEIYQSLDRLLNPRSPPTRWEPFLAKALPIVLRYGMPALKQAVAEGQYDYPRGLFFGGRGPSGTHRVLQEKLEHWLGDTRQVVHLDFHTGLGKWCSFQLLLDSVPTDAQRQWMTRWFGATSFLEMDSGYAAYSTRGSLGRWTRDWLKSRDYLYACAEFGTYRPLTVLKGLRSENRAHHWGQPNDQATRRAKERLKELFCPASMEWRTGAVADGLELIKKAVTGLAS